MKLQSFLAAGLALLVAPAWAQAPKFPESGKTIRIIVPFAAGGGVDNAARLLGEQLRKQLGMTVLVENRAGANGTLGGKAVQTAPADGYTLLFSAATHVLAKQVLSNAPYDPQADFAPVARVGEAPLVLVIAPQKEQQKLGEVLAAAKQQPGKWTAAIPATGAPSHLATLLLAKQGNVTFSYVPYKGTQPAMIDVGGGHVDLLMDSMISVLPLAKSGKVKPIAITSAKRSPLAPEIPTVQESGIPNFSYASWYGVWAPKDTPAERIAFLNTTINAAVSEIGKSGAYAKLGIEPVTESTEQFKRYIASDVAQSAELLKSAGFKPE
ncbi:Bug family tripartite tricarboxylate transporter substrate binding protein [Azohydromonas caseinilytica]|uniref:Tripartite tricarboxylate transporter substrate binding protein n=1 Tax=Azohydromonas caseinilytica TaxID=2728836 RepID=A0A848FHC7_9BURK|nr:tripartite tricarboxylate transporter substrate binding protein [Azohydromonas caseinilytica]NML18245.1 tripartite tricarboxylate transporter substrate binding protein [Azohydromonas caseinilytica]